MFQHLCTFSYFHFLPTICLQFIYYYYYNDYMMMMTTMMMMMVMIQNKMKTPRLLVMTKKRVLKRLPRKHFPTHVALCFHNKNRLASLLCKLLHHLTIWICNARYNQDKTFIKQAKNSLKGKVNFILLCLDSQIVFFSFLIQK